MTTAPKDHQVFRPQFSLDSPYVGDYFGIWMVHAELFQSMCNRLNGTNLTVHMQSPEIASRVSERDNGLYPVDRDGIASFQIAGPMMKAVPSMAEGSSYLRLRQQISAARRDPEVRAGLLMMDTPGGTAKGNEDLVKEVAKFAAEKPIYSFTEDMTASAGVSIASQATKRYANIGTAMYGAMGTYSVIQDVSGRADQLGIKVHVVGAGEFKGAGTPGTEITEAQLAEIQRVVNALNENYLALIASGLNRSVDSIRGLADGRVIMASDAVDAGLINGVQSLEETIQELRESVSRAPTTSPANRSNPNMADKVPATLQELKSTFPNSTADWRESQMEAGNDIAQASVAYATFVEERAKAERVDLEQKLEEAQKQNAQPSQSIGHEPLTAASPVQGGGLDSGDPIQDFNEAVCSRLPKHRRASFAERQQAIAAVARSRPELHQAYILANNNGSKQQRLIKEKYEIAAEN